jgi:putative Mg2+ transporter-C (MgtC) family protein
MILDLHIALRLVVAAILGGIVGFEREQHKRPAGLRTHMILAIGSALAMCVSIDLAMQFRAYAPNGDPARLAAQVISGIGFLGAGAILRYGSSIKGLTTAASLWTVAIIGLAVGAGHYIPALTATALLLAILTVLDMFEKRYISGRILKPIFIKARDRARFLEDFKDTLGDFEMDISSISVSKDIAARTIRIDAVVKIPQTVMLEEVVEALTKLDGTQELEMH